jgi:hypothetical protein
MPENVARRIQNAPDLLRRARNQRVHALSVNDVLEVILGVRVVGADAPYMQQLALENVDRLGFALSHRTLPTVVDRRLLTELLVDVSVGEQVRTRSPAQLLASWVQEPPHWSSNISQLVRDSMPALHGDEGRLLAWALAEPEPRLRDLVVHGAVLTVESAELPKPAWGPLWKAAMEPPIEMDRRILRRTVARLAEETLTALGDGAATLLSGADRIGRECLTPSELQTSRVLPLAFSDRCHALAQRAAAGKAINVADIAWLSTHRAARMNRGDLTVLEAMARISRYLDQPFTPRNDLLEQVREYQLGGAFADLAMLHLRRALASSVHYHAESGKVLAACRERRDRENRQFAESLANGYEAALHRDGLTPLHRLWKRTVAPVWQSDPDTRLFVIVLDGCSYPVFLELLHGLSQDSAFPLGIKPDSEGRVQGLPALSPLPTITSHARGAIFLGELPKDPLVAETVFRDQDEAKTDKARFNQNAAVGSRTRRLPEQQLDLFKLAATSPAQLRARATQIMGRDLRQPCVGRVLLDDVPDHFLGHPVAPHAPAAIDSPPHGPGLDPRRIKPVSRRDLDPGWDRYRTHPPALADQIRHNPPAVPLLNLFDSEPGQLRSPQRAPEQHCQNRPIALSFDRGCVRRGKQALRLLERQPVAQPHAEPLRTFHAADPGSQVWIEQSVIGSLNRQLADRGQPQVDCGRCQPVRRQLRAERLHCGLRERRSAVALPPLDEAVQRHAVRPARVRRSHAVEHQGLQLVPLIRAVIGRFRRDG